MTAMVRLPGHYGPTPVNPEAVAAIVPYPGNEDWDPDWLKGKPWCDLLMTSGQYLPVALSAEEAHAALFPEPEARPIVAVACRCGADKPTEHVTTGDHPWVVLKCVGCVRRTEARTFLEARLLWNREQMSP